MDSAKPRETKKAASIILRGLTRRSLVLLAILLAVFLLQSYTASLVKSPVWDEPIHIAAGLSYVESGRILLNQQHPPLLKEIGGIFLRASGVRWPSTPEATALINGALPLTDQVGNALVTDNGPDKVMFWSRLPFILLATVLGLVLYLLGRRLVGSAAALAAVFLYALDPTILAHSYLVTTDVGVAAFILVFLLALWEYLRRPGWVRMLCCGVALAAALGSKFSAVALLPVAGVLLLAAAFWPVASAAAKDAVRPPRAGRNAPCPCGSGKKYRRCHELLNTGAAASPSWRVMRYGSALAGMGVIAFLVLQVLYLFPKDPFAYLAGMRLVNGDHVPGFLAYMAGRLAPRFYSYYVVAYLLKEPLATILLTGIGLAVVVRGTRLTRLALLFIFVPAAALFAGYMLYSDNIGIRYIIPVLPFTYLLGGVGLAALVQNSRLWMRGAAAVLCLWLIVAAAGIYPDHLSYFNEAACLLDNPANIGLDGGSRCGPSWLADSNVDWGQGLKQLKAWLDRNASGRTVRLAYFGHVPPEAYGIRQEPMSEADVLGPAKPGLYAVSAHVVAYKPASAKRIYGAGAEWLRKTPPVAIVGHSHYIYEIAETPPDKGSH